VATALDQAQKRGWTARFLDGVERVGNKLPDAVTLFLWLIAIIVLLSVALSFMGAQAKHPGTGDMIEVKNLLSAEFIKKLLTEMPQTFASFPPLGTVIVSMIGVGLAERSGLLGTALAAMVRSVPKALLTATLVFAGVMSSLAVDAGYVVLVPLGAVLFWSVGRHPIAGLAAAFAGVSGGFSANLLITPLDALLAGISTQAAQLIRPGYEVAIQSNWYLMIALVPLFTIVGTWVTEKFVEPRLGAYKRPEGLELPEGHSGGLSDAERKGLRRAGLVFLGLIAVIAALSVPENAVLRDDKGSLEPLYKSLVAILCLGFLAMGLAYGKATGSIKTEKDAVQMCAKTMADLGYYLVLVLAIAHFLALFNWSNLGAYTAINAATGLQAIGITGVPLVILFVMLTGVVNLVMGSASAKWALMAPIFVPMLMLMGYSPEFTQAAYRVGDAFTNIITPLLPYFPMIIVFAKRYLPEFGIGSLVSVMLPYSIAFGISSTTLLLVWKLAEWQLGPGAMVSLPVAG
jgi:aminobenzoyl-glutamate transport protein